MYFRLAKRLLWETDKRLLWKLAYQAGWKGLRSVQKHKARLKRGEFFPPFLYISIINSCNLRCQGFWVDVAAKQTKIELEGMNRLINEAKAMGNSFFGILGGEPFMHPEILEIFETHGDCYFQVFTNSRTALSTSPALPIEICVYASSVEGSITSRRRGLMGSIHWPSM